MGSGHRRESCWVAVMENRWSRDEGQDEENITPVTQRRAPETTPSLISKGSNSGRTFGASFAGTALALATQLGP